MEKVFIDFVDELHYSELTPKGWNFVATPLLVLAGYFWVVFSDYGTLFQVTGCIAYICASMLWITKSGWGQALLETIFVGDEDVVLFENLEE